jgi:hypothetical protein
MSANPKLKRLPDDGRPETEGDMTIARHHGGCHCGAVRFTARLDLDAPVVVCNCSICRKNGAMLSAVAAEDFTLDQGEDALTTYRFNTGQITHQFCSTCGVQGFSSLFKDDGKAVNVRTLDGVDLDGLKTLPFDGASL